MIRPTPFSVSRTFARCLCFLVMGSVVATAAEPELWNQWRGPSRDGRLDSANWPDQLEGRLELVWEKSHAPSYSGPVLSGDVVFTTETVGRRSEQVTAYRAASGEQVWQVDWEGYMAVPFFAVANGDWIRSTPVCVPGHLIVLGMRDVLVSLDPATGDTNWRIDFPKAKGSPLQPFGAVCSPVVDDDAVYVQSGGGLTKVALQTGKVIWQSLGGGGDMMSDGAFSSPIIATIAGVRQLVVQTREKLCGVDMADGQTLWSEPIEAFRGMNILTPLVVGDAVFTAAHSGRSQLFDISRNGDSWSVVERWNQKTQGYMSSPVLIGDQIYLHLKNERFCCLSVADGSIGWTSEPVGKYWSMVHDGRRILSLADDGVLRLIDANAEIFRVVDTARVAKNSWAHLAIQDDLLLVRDLDSLRVFRWTR